MGSTSTYNCFADWYEELTRLLVPNYYGPHPEDMALLEGIIDRYLNNGFNKENHWILELGCGTGRLTIPLLNAGYRVASVEYSKGMLEKMKVKLTNCDQKTINENLFIVNSDLKQIDANYFGDRRIKVVISPWSFLHSFSQEEQGSLLNGLYSILDDGGLLVDLDAYQIFWGKDELGEAGTLVERGLEDHPIFYEKEMKKLRIASGNVYALVDIFYYQKDILPSIIQLRKFLRNNEIIVSEKYLVQPPHDFVLQLQKAAYENIAVLNTDLSPFVYHKGMTNEAEGVIYVATKKYK